ncbi:MAG: PAS domain-containing protein [Phycisphaerae bacterium]
MALRRPHLTGVERTFGQDEIIVSKTDPTGHITYANQVFLRIAQFTEDEVLGKPHSIVRHPDMPRCVFKLLWDTIQAGSEIFAYVLNRAKNGDHYWVFAHVTPTLNEQGKIIAYHSNRRSPNRAVLPKVKELYDWLLREESRFGNPKEAMAASIPKLLGVLQQRGVSYEEFVFSL